jgi:hypothetical protein
VAAPDGKIIVWGGFDTRHMLFVFENAEPEGKLVQYAFSSEQLGIDEYVDVACLASDDVFATLVLPPRNDNPRKYVRVRLSDGVLVSTAPFPLDQLATRGGNKPSDGHYRDILSIFPGASGEFVVLKRALARASYGLLVARYRADLSLLGVHAIDMEEFGHVDLVQAVVVGSELVGVDRQARETHRLVALPLPADGDLSGLQAPRKIGDVEFPVQVQSRVFRPSSTLCVESGVVIEGVIFYFSIAICELRLPLDDTIVLLSLIYIVIGAQTGFRPSPTILVFTRGVPVRSTHRHGCGGHPGGQRVGCGRRRSWLCW